MDILSLVGAILGIMALLGGAALEGLPIESIMVPTAAAIVFGGTIGAVLLSSSSHEVAAAKALTGQVFKAPHHDLQGLAKEILELSRVARRDGMLVLEQRLPELKHPLLRRGIGFLIDGVTAAEVRSRLELASEKDGERYHDAARVYEAAGGYAPTVGILGAVLGLIHVMHSLDDPSKLGGGIAVAFVATVYGVGFANLICLPLAAKLKARMRTEESVAAVVIEGVAGMADGQPTSALEQALNVLIGEPEKEKPAEAEGAPAPA